MNPLKSSVNMQLASVSYLLSHFLKVAALSELTIADSGALGSSDTFILLLEKANISLIASRLMIN